MKRRWDPLSVGAAAQAQQDDGPQQRRQSNRRRVQQAKAEAEAELAARASLRRVRPQDDQGDRVEEPKRARPYAPAERRLVDLPPQVRARLPRSAVLARAGRQHAAAARHQERRQSERSAERQHAERAARLRASGAGKVSQHHIAKRALGPGAHSAPRAREALRWALVTPGAGAMQRRLVAELAAELGPPPAVESWDPIAMTSVAWETNDCIRFELWLRTLEEAPFPASCALCDTSQPGPVVRHPCGHCAHLACYEPWRAGETSAGRQALCWCGHVVAEPRTRPAYALAHGTHNVLDVGPHVFAPSVYETRSLMWRAASHDPPGFPGLGLTIERMLSCAARADMPEVVGFMLEERPLTLATARELRAALKHSPESLKALLGRAPSMPSELVREAFATGDARCIPVLLADARCVPTVDDFGQLLARAAHHGPDDAAGDRIARIQRMVLPAATASPAAALIVGGALLAHILGLRVNRWLTPMVLEALDQSGNVPSGSPQFAHDWWTHVVDATLSGRAERMMAAETMAACLVRHAYVPPQRIAINVLASAAASRNLGLMRVVLDAGSKATWSMILDAGDAGDRDVVHALLEHLGPAEIAQTPADLELEITDWDRGSVELVRMFVASFASRH